MHLKKTTFMLATMQIILIAAKATLLGSLSLKKLQTFHESLNYYGYLFLSTGKLLCIYIYMLRFHTTIVPLSNAKGCYASENPYKEHCLDNFEYTLCFYFLSEDLSLACFFRCAWLATLSSSNLEAKHMGYVETH